MAGKLNIEVDQTISETLFRFCQICLEMLLKWSPSLRKCRSEHIESLKIPTEARPAHTQNPNKFLGSAKAQCLEVNQCPETFFLHATS